MTKKVEKGNQVKVHYRGTLTDGTEFDNSHNRDTPLEFQVGANQMIKGFSDAVIGMGVGETKSVSIPSAEAYGEFKPEANTVLPRSAFPETIDIQEGMPVPLKTDTGQTLMGRVTQLGEDVITVDLNHPLAGQDLQFEIELVEVVETDTDTTETTE
jgi:peptidylprolyl isomerase